MKAVRYSALFTVVFFLLIACQKEFSLDNVPASAKAGGSLKDSSGNCLSIAVNGSYVSGSALTDSNYVVVQVNFSSAGSYNISTDSSNGFYFSGSGVIADSGYKNIILKGIGKPAVAAQTNFSIVFDSSVCTFGVNVAADSTGVVAGPPSEDSAWQFSSGSGFYHGFVDSAFTHTDTSISKDSSILSFYGASSNDAADTLFQLDILLPGKIIKAGNYSTDLANVDFYLYNQDTTAAPNPYFVAYPKLVSGVNLQVNIAEYSTETGIVSGSFSGTALNDKGQTVAITGGKIYAQVR